MMTEEAKKARVHCASAKFKEMAPSPMLSSKGSFSQSDRNGVTHRASIQRWGTQEKLGL